MHYRACYCGARAKGKRIKAAKAPLQPPDASLHIVPQFGVSAVG